MVKKALVRFLTIFLLSSLLALWIVQENALVQRKVIDSLISFLEDEWDADVSAEATKINLFTKSIYITGGKVFPKSRSCSWSFGSGKVSISLWDLFINKTVSLYLCFNDLVGSTSLKGDNPELIAHFIDIFDTEQTVVTISPQAVMLNNAKISLALDNKKIDCALEGTFALRKQEGNKERADQWVGSFVSRNGFLSINDTLILSDFSSTTIFSKEDNDSDSWKVTTDQRFALHDMAGSVPCWLRSKGADFSVTGNKDDIQIEILNRDSLQVKGRLPRSVVEHGCRAFFHAPFTGQRNGESITIDATLENFHNEPSIKGSLALLHNAVVPELRLQDLVVTATQCSAAVEANTYEDIAFKGKCRYSFASGTGEVSLKNCSALPSEKKRSGNALGSWSIDQDKVALSLQIAQDNTLSGVLDICATNQLSGEEKESHLSLLLKNKVLEVEGQVGEGVLDFAALLEPHLHCKRLSFKSDVSPRSFVHLLASPRNPLKLTGIISYPFIQSLLPYDVQYMALGKSAQMGFVLNQQNPEHIQGSLSLKKGSLYIPQSHNLIEDGSVSFALLPTLKKLMLYNCSLVFHKGFMKVPHASFELSDDFSLKRAHCPLEINDLFLNWQQDLYAFVYGTIQLSKNDAMPLHLGGSLILKKAFLRDGIFPASTGKRVTASAFSPGSLAQDVFTLSLDVTTEQPMKVRTEFLDAQVRAALHIEHTHRKNEFNVPRVTGTMSLDQGKLKFLQNTLFIEHGRIQFLTNQLSDPIIELTAKNRINKYLITMHATGSLQKPNIILESVPELTEEQIVNVLLSGSQETTLQKDLAAILLQNLNVILMGNKKLPKKTNSLLARLTRPFKYIQITPDFTDQSGRGGIKGIVSVDLTKQLHAQFQKNFNLQEDFAFHVGYLLADDVYLKAIKDQRGELGAETGGKV